MDVRTQRPAVVAVLCVIALVAAIAVVVRHSHSPASDWATPDGAANGPHASATKSPNALEKGSTRDGDVTAANANGTGDVHVATGHPAPEISARLQAELAERATRALALNEAAPGASELYESAMGRAASDADTHALAAAVDAATALVERNLNSGDPLLAYKFCLETLSKVQSLQGALRPEASAVLETGRLVVLKSQIERMWGEKIPGVPRFDEQAGKDWYKRLADARGPTPVDEYRRMAALFDAQSALLGSLSDTAPLSTLIDAAPVVSSPRDEIQVARLRAKAFLTRADLLPLEKHTVGDRAQLQQYAIDVVERLSPGASGELNAVDKQYFRTITTKAQEGRSQTLAHAEALGVSVEQRIARRKNVDAFRVGGGVALTPGG